MITLTAETADEDHMTGERGQGYRQWLAERTVAVVGLARSGVAAARLIRRRRSVTFRPCHDRC